MRYSQGCSHTNDERHAVSPISLRLLRPLVLTAWLFTIFACVLPGGAGAAGVTAFAAASLKSALDEIAISFHEETGHEVIASFAASSALAQQIRRGAPADIYISANQAWMDRLEQEDLLQPGSRFDLLTNAIVLIGHGKNLPPLTIDSDLDLAGMLGQGWLAMALVNAAPAGIYGKAALHALGLWDSVKSRVAQTDNVRAALRMVATGSAPMGIVYATDAHVSDRVSVLGTFPAYTHPEIIYPAAAVASSRSPATRQFLAYLRAPTARMTFERQGFTVATR